MNPPFLENYKKIKYTSFNTTNLIGHNHLLRYIGEIEDIPGLYFINRHNNLVNMSDFNMNNFISILKINYTYKIIDVNGIVNFRMPIKEGHDIFFLNCAVENFIEIGTIKDKGNV